MDLDQLQRQHDELQLLADRFHRAILDDSDPQPLGTLRWQFARQLLAHLALEDRFFYPAMQRQPHEGLRATAGRLQQEMAPIAKEFSNYVARWSDDRIAREWAGFCHESREMLSAIVQRMAKEERLLMPLLVEAGLNPPRISRVA